MTGNTALTNLFCLTSSTQTQTGAKEAQHSGCLEGLHRHRKASLKLKLLATAHSTEGHEAPVSLHSCEGSLFMLGSGFQAVIYQLVELSIFNNF